MIHIGGHLQNFTSSELVRPDYFVLDHMRKHGIISAEDYKFSMKYTERPRCDGLVPYGYLTPDMRTKTESSKQEIDDLAKEYRYRRRLLQSKAKGKGIQARPHNFRESSPAPVQDSDLETKSVQIQGLDPLPRQTRYGCQGPPIRVDESQQEHIEDLGNASRQDLEQLSSGGDARRKRRIMAVTKTEDDTLSSPMAANNSTSEHPTESSRSRSTYRSHTQTEALSRSTELTSLNGSLSLNAIGSKMTHAQTLLDRSLFPDEIESFEHMFNTSATSDKALSSSIAASHTPTWALEVFKSKNFSQDSILLQLDSSSVGQGFEASSRFDADSRRDSGGRNEPTKYYRRVPDNGNTHFQPAN
jgi:hypothetical protein